MTVEQFMQLIQDRPELFIRTRFEFRTFVEAGEFARLKLHSTPLADIPVDEFIATITAEVLTMGRILNGTTRL